MNLAQTLLRFHERYDDLEIVRMMSRRNVLALGAGLVVVGAGAGGYWVSSGGSYDEAVKSTWQPSTAAGEADLNYLVYYATLAANSHNAQPWLFSGSAKGVKRSPDNSRSLPAADPDNHHLFASLGCAAENLMLAAAASGRSATANFVADGDSHIDIDFAPGAPVKSHLFDAILDRQCTRSDYDGRAVSQSDLDSCVNAAKVDGCEIILIRDKARIEQALELILTANKTQIENPAFAAELKSWLRFSPASAMKMRDGLYAACSGNPTMPNWLGRLVFDFVFTAGSENDRTAKHVRSSSGLAIFVTDKDDKDHWVRAGRCYQRFALMTTSLGVRHAFIN
jgi:hypothetical protein